MSSYTHDTNVKLLRPFAFAVKKIFIIWEWSNRALSFITSIKDLCFSLAAAWSPADISSIRDCSLLRAKREVKILLSAYKAVNTGWHLLIPNIHVVLIMWPLTLPLQKMIRPFACPSFPVSVEQQWFERGKLKCLASLHEAMKNYICLFCK